jgi:hypothetical protein
MQFTLALISALLSIAQVSAVPVAEQNVEVCMSFFGFTEFLILSYIGSSC